MELNLLDADEVVNRLPWLPLFLMSSVWILVWSSRLPKAGRHGALLEATLASSGALLVWFCVPVHVLCLLVVFVASLLLYCRMRWESLRKLGLITLLAPATQSSLLNMRMLDWLRSPSLSVALGKILPLFSPGVDDEAVAEFLRGAPATFQESMLRPGLVHSLPAGVADLLLPSDSPHRLPWTGITQGPAAGGVSSASPDAQAADAAGAVDSGASLVAPATPARSAGSDVASAGDGSSSSSSSSIGAGSAAASHCSPGETEGVAGARGFTASLVALPESLVPTKEALWASGFVSQVYRRRLAAVLGRADGVMLEFAPQLHKGAVAAGAIALLLLLASKRARSSSLNQVLGLILGTPATAAVLLAAAAAVAHKWPTLRRAIVAVLLGAERRS